MAKTRKGRERSGKILHRGKFCVKIWKWVGVRQDQGWGDAAWLLVTQQINSKFHSYCICKLIFVECLFLNSICWIRTIGNISWVNNIDDLFFLGAGRERETEHKQGRGRERERIRSAFQALSCKHRAQRRAQSHELWDHDLNWSRTLNQLSHPGTPTVYSFWLNDATSLLSQLALNLLLTLS